MSIEKINLSVKNGKGKVIQVGDTANITLTVPPQVATTTTTTTGITRQYAEISQEVTYTGFTYYKAKLINDIGTKTYTTTPATEVTLNRIIHIEGAVDFTEYFPWFKEDDVIMVYQSDVDVDDTWYVDTTFTYIDNEDVNSLAVVESTGRLKAVWV